MSYLPNPSLIEGLFAPLVEIYGLARQSISLHAELARREALVRVKALAASLGLVLAAVAMLLLMLILAVKTGLLGLMALGLSPFYAHLLTTGICLLVVVVLVPMARAALSRALRPFAAAAASTQTAIAPIPPITAQGDPLLRPHHPDPAEDPR